MDRPIKLLIVDSNTDFTAILSDIISSNPKIEIVGLIQDETEAREVLEPPDVLLARISAPIDITQAPASLEARITHTLNMLGVPAHIKGFHYVRKAIAVTIENDDSISAVTKIIYPYVAKIYSTTPSRVERAIRHAIEVAWNRCTAEILQTIFDYFINCENRRPTNSEFIAGIADHLRTQSLDE